MIDVDAEHVKTYAKMHAGSDSDRGDPLEAGNEADTAEASNMAATATTNEPMNALAESLKRGEADGPVQPGSPKSNVLEMINLQLQGTKGWSFWWASPENTEAWGVPRSTTNASSDKHWHEPLRARRLPSEIRLQSWWCWWHGKVWHGILWWSVSSWGWSMFGQRCKHVQDHGAAYVSSFSQRTRTERWWALAFGCTGRPAWTSEAGAFAGSTGPWCSATYFKRFEHSICAHLARKAQFKGRSNMAEEIEVRCSWVCLVGARKRKPIQSCVWQYHFQSFANSFLGKTWKRKPCDGQPGR